MPTAFADINIASYTNLRFNIYLRRFGKLAKLYKFHRNASGLYVWSRQSKDYISYHEDGRYWIRRLGNKTVKKYDAGLTALMPTTSQQIDAMGSRENPQEEIYRERFRRVKVFSAVSWRSLSGDQKLFHEDFEGGRKSKVFSAFATLRWTAYVGGPETDWIINCPTLQRVDMEKELEKLLNNTGPTVRPI